MRIDTSISGLNESKRIEAIRSLTTVADKKETHCTVKRFAHIR